MSQVLTGETPIPVSIVAQLQQERKYQLEKGREGKIGGADGWSYDFDDRNTPNDWAAYVNIYLGRAVQTSNVQNPATAVAEFRKNMLKVATLAVAAVEAVDRSGVAPRHYDANLAG